MVEFTCEAICSWAFICWNIFDYSFYTRACDGSQDFLFLPDSVLEGYNFPRICSFLPGCAFYWHTVAESSLLWSFAICCGVLSVMISPLSFLILLIWFFSLFWLMSLDNGFSILFIFSKNQLLALLIFTIVSFVYFSFITALFFMISFLLLTLVFLTSSFSSCFRCKVR